MERFDAMVLADGHQPTANANGSNATSASATTESLQTATMAGEIQANREHRTSNGSKANAGPAVGRQTQRSALPNDGEAQNSVSSSEASAKGDNSTTTDTPAAAASPQAPAVSHTDKSTRPETKAASDTAKKDPKTYSDSTKNDQSLVTSTPTENKSRYAKAQERLEKTWESVNKRKGELDAQAQSIEQQRLALERDKAQFEVVRRQADQPSATPEQALQAAQLRRRDADALRMQAKRAADAGRIDESQRLNKQADKAESLAEEMSDYAEQLRKNPPVSMQQRQQQFEQARKDWTLEACNAFPELGKNGSRLQQVVAQHMNALAKQDPQLLVHPSLVYHVARLGDAQIKAADLEAAAARVPVLEKEAESLRARIQELEASTTPASNGGVSRLSDEPRDDYASLRMAASEMGSMFR